MSNSKDQVLEGYVKEEIEENPKVELPRQFEFYKVPRRFGSIPVDELPFGCDKEEQYYKAYPRVSLPFQRVDRVSFGHPELEPNRLFWGDNLHVMRMLPSGSIDLIYIDPPFFSGRQYNVIFGDQNEVRSFTDIWEDGMPGYLTWLNARLLEMKRLLKPNGSIYVHLDWHASHYVKCEMDKIFGYRNFLNEVVWAYRTQGATKKRWSRKHDVLLFYSKTDTWKFNAKTERSYMQHKYGFAKDDFKIDEEGRQYRDALIRDVWEISALQSATSESIGYPTQKPEKLLERIIYASSNPNDVVADFFCGGGTTPTVAHGMDRRWIACDISRIAVAITADRVTKVAMPKDPVTSRTKVQQTQQVLSSVPDMSVEYWGVYEVPALTTANDEEFRRFIIAAYDGRLATGEGYIHGYKHGLPLYVGSPSQEKPVTKDEVINFAANILTRKGKHQGEILAWAFTPSARLAVEELTRQEKIAVDFVKISLVPIESEKFREHVVTKHKDYSNFLTFVLPPQVRLRYKRLAPLMYEFDISESVSLNSGGKIANVQWDFDYKTRFVSTKGYATILLLRKFSSPVYGQQVIGRGLRRIIRDESEPEILAVVDHPKLQHDWLWRLVAVSKIRQGVGPEDRFGDEDLPMKLKIQKLVNPDKFIVIPEPEYETKIDFKAISEKVPGDKIEQNWRQLLDAVTYEREAWMITKTRVEQIKGRRLKDRRVEILQPGSNSDQTAIEEREKTPAELREDLKNEVLDLASGLLIEAGFGGLRKGELYNAMMDHVIWKIFNGNSLAEADKNDIEFAIYSMPQIRKNFTSQIIAGILKG